MTLRIYGSEMYLELARVFAGAKIAITDLKPNLRSSTDLPIATQAHLQFVMSAVAIIFSVSYLEAHVNRWLDELLNDRLEFTDRNAPPDVKQNIAAGVQQLKKKYPSDTERNRLFKREELAEKIKLLYRTLGVPLPFNSAHKEERRLWERLIDLQNLRNELIHLKPEFLTSAKFMDYLRMDHTAREELVRVPTLMVALMSERLPVLDVNLTENAILSEAILVYADKPFFENLMLGHNYSDQERQKYLRRQPKL